MIKTTRACHAAFALLAVFSLTLAGCGSGSGAGDASGDGRQAPGTAPSSVPGDDDGTPGDGDLTAEPATTANQSEIRSYCGSNNGRVFTTRSTAYYPSNSSIEGGFVDRRGKPLRTLQSFVNGRADYVSVAMDSRAFAYGTRVYIPAIENKFGRKIEFRVVDTGGAFKGKGTSRMDICVSNRANSLKPEVNRSHRVIVCR